MKLPEKSAADSGDISMKILLHLCCGPCGVYPLAMLKKAGAEVTAFWFNHNIHPYQEYVKRRDAAAALAELSSIPIISDDDYALETFLENVAADPVSRCSYCYASRLDAVAKSAAQHGFEYFTSSLLYSRYQKHEDIKTLAEDAAKRHGVKFYYDDFRVGWQEGIRLSKEMGLYRQQYCGCIYSEKERYCRPK